MGCASLGFDPPIYLCVLWNKMKFHDFFLSRVMWVRVRVWKGGSNDIPWSFWLMKQHDKKIRNWNVDLLIIVFIIFGILVSEKFAHLS